VELLLGAGANTTLLNAQGRTAEDILREKQPNLEAAFALFAQVPDSWSATLLVHARRLVVASHGLPLTHPPAKAKRDGQRAASLRVELAPMASPSTTAAATEGGAEEATAAAAAAVGGDSADSNAGNGLEEGAGGVMENKEARKLRVLVAFLLGLSVGPEGHAVPQLPGGVFVLVMTMLMPRWDPLRKCMKEMCSVGRRKEGLTVTRPVLGRETGSGKGREKR